MLELAQFTAWGVLEPPRVTVDTWRGRSGTMGGTDFETTALNPPELQTAALPTSEDGRAIPVHAGKSSKPNLVM